MHCSFFPGPGLCVHRPCLATFRLAATGVKSTPREECSRFSNPFVGGEVRDTHGRRRKGKRRSTRAAAPTNWTLSSPLYGPFYFVPSPLISRLFWHLGADGDPHLNYSPLLRSSMRQKLGKFPLVQLGKRRRDKYINLPCTRSMWKDPYSLTGGREGRKEGR